MSNQIYKQRRTNKAIRCYECDQSVRLHEEYVFITIEVYEGSEVYTYTEPAHLACAGTEGKLEACPTCFLIGGQCAC